MIEMPIPAMVALIVAAVLLVVLGVVLVIGVVTQHVRVTGLSAGEDDEDDEELPDEVSTLLSMLPDVSILVDEQDEVVRCSPGAYRLGVVQEDAIVGKELLDAIHDTRRHGGKRQFDLTTDTPERYAEERDKDRPVRMQSVRRPNWLKITVGRVNSRFVIVLVDDVSESVRFAQVRDAFITNVSEQLLGPTEALSKLADSLEQGEPNRERIADDARQVRSSCGKLNHMVSDLLLLIRAQEPITPSSANRLPVMGQLRKTVERLTPQAERAGVSLRLNGDDTVVVNDEGGQIDSAVTKLIENAIGYSKEGGVVSVSASKTEDGSRVSIRVIDQGAGIAKKDQERIFERFYRGTDQNARTADGVGLGLAIAKHVALTHHGSIAVWSTPGQGSTFTLTLPVAQ